ncbi:type I restriction-modification system subunit M [Microbacterium sp. NPDC055683]
MITGDVKQKVNAVWNAFWTGGISNPMEVVEQITYMLFIRRLDDLQRGAEARAKTLGGEPDGPIPAGRDDQWRPYADLRWSTFKNFDPETMYEVVSERVFPFLRAMGGDGSTYARHMKDARFTIPTPNLLTKVVDLVGSIPLESRDTNGDLYEYLLSKLQTSGQNGQFRTPRHIIKLMVDMTAPQPGDVIVDPACGTAGFLVMAEEHLLEHHREALRDRAAREHFDHDMFHGFDFDSTMLRIGSMNMLLHGVQNPSIVYRDSLTHESDDEEGKYSLVLANPPFAGSLDYEQVNKHLLADVKTKKTELLFLALILRLLKPGGRAAVVVPDGVLFGSTTAHKKLRKALVEDHQLQAVVKLPSGVFKPYAGVSTAILFFTKTGVGGTDDVWFYDVAADGFSLDDKRTEIAANDLPDVLARWQNRAAETDRARTEQSFLVPKADIAANDYDLSINRYKEIEHEEVEHADPADIIAALERIDEEISAGLQQLKGMLA